jgi:hypothetical protein
VVGISREGRARRRTYEGSAYAHHTYEGNEALFDGYLMVI